MEVSTSQALAVTVQATHQQQVGTSGRERDDAPIDRARTTEVRPSADVSFSSEALRLSGQDDPSTVNQASESETASSQQQQLAANPELGRAAAANTVAQAINAYRDTSII